MGKPSPRRPTRLRRSTAAVNYAVGSLDIDDDGSLYEYVGTDSSTSTDG